jgi:hypothetical protein
MHDPVHLCLFQSVFGVAVVQGFLRLKLSVQHLFCLEFDKKDKKTLLFTFVGKDVSNLSLNFEKPA